MRCAPQVPASQAGVLGRFAAQLTSNPPNMAPARIGPNWQSERANRGRGSLESIVDLMLRHQDQGFIAHIRPLVGARSSR